MNYCKPARRAVRVAAYYKLTAHWPVLNARASCTSPRLASLKHFHSSKPQTTLEDMDASVNQPALSHRPTLKDCADPVAVGHHRICSGTSLHTWQTQSATSPSLRCRDGLAAVALHLARGHHAPCRQHSARKPAPPSRRPSPRRRAGRLQPAARSFPAAELPPPRRPSHPPPPPPPLPPPPPHPWSRRCRAWCCGARRTGSSSMPPP